MDDYKQSFNDQASSFDSFELQLTSLAKEFLAETAKWAKFLSIVGFVIIGFIVLGGFFMFAAGSAFESMGAGFGAGFGAIAGIFYLLIALLYFFPVLYLYKFANNAKSALRDNNSENLTVAFENLKSHYKFVGILTLIMVCIYGLIFLITIMAGIGAAAMS
jgi:hypothetical protein